MKKAILLLIIFLFSSAAVIAREEKVFVDLTNQSSIDLNKSAYVLKHKPETVSLYDLSSADVQKKFKLLNLDEFNFGFNDYAYWLKINFRNQTTLRARHFLEIAYPHLDKVYFVEEDEKGIRPEVDFLGDSLPFYKRTYIYRNFVHYVSLRPHQEKSIYIYIESKSSKQIPLKLWSELNFIKMLNYENGWFGLFFGIIVSMMVFNFLMFLILRDGIYLNFIFFVGINSLFLMAYYGLGYMYLWSDYSIIQDNATPFLIGIGMFSLILFSKSFLRTKQEFPATNKILTAAAILSIIAASITFFSYRWSITAGMVLSIASPIVLIIASIKGVIKKYRPASIFLISCLFYLVGIIALALKSMQLAPINFFTENSMMIGSALQIILLSLALSEKINVIKKEKEIAQQQAIDQLQKINRMNETYKKQLEIQVEERTSELRERKEDLEKSNSQIKFQNDKLEQLYQDITEKNELLEIEKQKTDDLLYNIFPEIIVHRLKGGETYISDYFDNVSIIFIDIVHFTEIFRNKEPHVIVDTLNEIFTLFDKISFKYGLEKIKTIGDCYMAAAGAPVPCSDYAERSALMALEITSIMKEYTTKDGYKIDFRIGLNCGPVVAGIIGEQKYIYDMWGDSVNMASRMEENCEPGKIQVTEEFYNKLNDKFVFEERGIMDIKGKGLIKTYFLLQKIKKPKTELSSTEMA